LEPFIATGRRKHSDRVHVAPRGRLPDGLSVKDRMARKLRSPETQRGDAPRLKWIKHARAFRQFLRAGASASRRIMNETTLRAGGPMKPTVTQRHRSRHGSIVAEPSC
jgi:hypothetical protein